MELWDYVSMGVLVTFTCAVGIYQVLRTGSGERTTDFLVTNKDLSVLSLVMSIVATMTSALSTSGFIMEVYSHGIIFILIAVFNLFAGIFCAFFYLPVYYQLNVQSIYEYLELRFDSKLRLLISVLQNLQMLIISSCFLYAVSLVLNQVSDMSIWTSVSVIGMTVSLYTAIGGFKAVVWADVAQQVVIYATLILLIVRGLDNGGGVGAVWEKLVASNRSDFFVWTPNPNTQYSVWTFAIGYQMVSISYFSASQALMQRCLSNKTLTKAKMCMIVGSVGYSICLILIVMCGAIVTALYYDCDPLLMGKVKTRDQLLALLAVDTLTLYKGLTGIFVAGLICATISTLSSLLNSMAAVTMADYVRPFFPNLKPKTSLTLSKVITLVQGLMTIGLVAGIQKAGGIIKIMFAIKGLFVGPTLGLFTVGMLLPWVTTKAALVGVVASVILPWWVCIAQMTVLNEMPHLPFIASTCSNISDVIYDSSQMSLLHRFYSVSPLWFTTWSVVATVVVSLIAGMFFGFQDPSKVDRALLFPVVRHFIKPNPVIQKTELKLLDN